MGGKSSHQPASGGSAPQPRRLGDELRSRAIVVTGGARPSAYRARRVILRAPADRAGEIIGTLPVRARSAADRAGAVTELAGDAGSARLASLCRPVGGRCTVIDVASQGADEDVTPDAVAALRTADISAVYNTVYFGQALPSVSPLYHSASAGAANLSTVTPAPEPAPWAAEAPGDDPPLVAILDTGLHTTAVGGARVPAHPWLRGHVAVHEKAWEFEDVVVATPEGPVVLKAGDEDLPDENGDDVLDRQAGHGTFISGIVRRLAPHAQIHVDGCLTSFGDGDDESITRSLNQLARRIDRRHRLDRLVVNLSFGGYTEDDQPPPLLGEAIADLAAQGVAFVAAAGNDDTSRKLWPAALPDVIAVGALDSAAGKAWFSNHGGWVDASAPGIDVVSTFFDTTVVTDPYEPEPVRYGGFATWSGTSFAAPQVAAAVAAEMVRTGATAADAARALVEDSRRFRLTDLGVVVNAV